MPSLSEISSSIRGAWRLFLMDPKGMEEFNLSASGFWNSFFAAVLLAPIYLFILMAQYRISDEVRLRELERNPDNEALTVPVEFADFLLANSLAYVVLWALFPIVMMWMTRLLQISDRFVPFVVAYNWSTVTVFTLQLPPFALYYFGIVGLVGAIAPLLSIVLVVMIYRWYIAYAALGVPVITCLGFVTLDFMINTLVQLGAAAFISVD